MPSNTYSDIGGPTGYLASHSPFQGNSMWAVYEGKDYVVFSYSTEIARLKPNGEKILNTEKYSNTTSRHQNLCRAWL